MKRISLICFAFVLVFFVSNIYGQSPTEEQLERISEMNEKLCKSISITAGSIMKARQSGYKMSELMDLFSRHDVSENVYITVKGLVVQAYDSPRFMHENNITKAIVDFENDVYLECTKMFDEQFEEIKRSTYGKATD